MPVYEIAMLIDARGLPSPMATTRTRDCLRSIDAGEVVEVFATDPDSVLDVPAWATSTGHQLLDYNSTGSTYTFVIRK